MLILQIPNRLEISSKIVYLPIFVIFFFLYKHCLCINTVVFSSIYILDLGLQNPLDLFQLAFPQEGKKKIRV